MVEQTNKQTTQTNQRMNKHMRHRFILCNASNPMEITAAQPESRTPNLSRSYDVGGEQEQGRRNVLLYTSDVGWVSKLPGT